MLYSVNKQTRSEEGDMKMMEKKKKSVRPDSATLPALVSGAQNCYLSKSIREGLFNEIHRTLVNDLAHSFADAV